MKNREMQIAREYVNHFPDSSAQSDLERISHFLKWIVKKNLVTFTTSDNALNQIKDQDISSNLITSIKEIEKYKVDRSVKLSMKKIFERLDLLFSLQYKVRILPDVNLESDYEKDFQSLGITSLDLFSDMLIYIEEEFNINISQKEYSELKTFYDIAKLVFNKINNE